VAKGIAKFIDVMAKQGGMSYSNNFDVEFMFNKSQHTDLRSRFKTFGIDFGNLGTNATDADENAKGTPTDVLKMFCEEAQIPNVQAATGQLNGRLMGEGQVNYAHTKLYTDFQLGWMCDANMTPLKFLNAWYSFIFEEYDEKGVAILGSAGGGNYAKKDARLRDLKKETGLIGSREKSVRLRFPDEYQCNVAITKTEKGSSAANSRGSMMYTLIDCFPYAIDAVPLSYGASQVTKVTANFYYSKYSVVYNDITKFRG
jgi:hypothetical protein